MGLATEPTDAGLLDLAQSASRAGVDGLFRAYSPRVFHFAMRMLDDEGAAQDVTIAAFTTAYREIVTFTSPAGFLLKLFETAVKESIHRARAIAPSNPGWVEVDADAALAQPDVEERVRAALDRVPPGERATWLLRLLEGMTDEEVAFASGRELRGAARAESLARVAAEVDLARRQFLAHFSPTPATDPARAAQAADRLGAAVRRRGVPANVWATIDRALRAERLVQSEPEPKPGFTFTVRPEIVALLVGLALIVIAGIFLRGCLVRVE